MKTYNIKIVTIFFTTFLFWGCNDDFLERYPLDALSNETFWNSENDLMVYNNSIYDYTKDDDKTGVMLGHSSKFASTHGSYQYLDEFTDNLAPGNGRANRFKDVRAGIHIPAGRQWFGYQDWELLREINVGLEHYGQADLDQSTIDKYAGEARMFRAWFYYDKVSKFGDVQWIDHELNTDSPELYGKRDPREFVMGKVLEDINFAVEKLPKDWKLGQDPGRLDKWSALALKARICLFEGTWRKYHGGTDAEMWLQQAVDAAKQIIDEGPFSLFTGNDSDYTYNALHRLQDLTGNPEIIYWVKYESGVRDNNIMKYYLYYSGGATKDMVEDYLCIDGLPISLSTEYQGDAEIEDVFVKRDPRLRQTVLHPEDQDYYEYNLKDGNPYPRVTGMSAPGEPSTTGYHVIKTYVQSVHAGNHNSGTTPGIVFRLAEVYLNYAEAKAELGTITQSDLDMSINKLRDRVAMPHMSLNPPMDPRYADDGISSLLVEIRRERRVELFSEGFRYDDLRRWKQGKKLEEPSLGLRWDDAAIARYTGAKVKTTVVDGVPYIDPYKETPWGTPVFDENKHYLWPIPLPDLGENPELGQNPGW